MKRIPILQLLIITIIALISHNAVSQSSDFEILKNIDVYTSLFKELNSNYVDEINPGEMMEDGIDAMLEDLDPYTVFIPEAQAEDYKFITTGEYGGIGALIQQQGEYVLISEPYEGFPADKAGIKAGDKILEVNGKSAKGMSTSDVSNILKGQAGSTVELLIERPKTEKPLKIEILREEVKIPNVPYSGILDKNIGYIKLTGFTQKAGSDVKKAFTALNSENKIKGLIIDLRGNGGGLLQEAVNITNMFVERGKEVVSTKGKLKEKNRAYKTMLPPVDTEIPLVVLVDKASASASEIVSGSLQDLDRALIIGQRTFGKGLVQNIVPLSYNNRLKVTVAKYYIPSGRCIQAIDYSHKDEYGTFTKIPDSLISEFETANGRKVYDGGGIEPDINVPPLRYSDITLSLFAKQHIFNYATDFYYEHQSIAAAKDFEINDEIFNDFLEYLNDKDYEFELQCEKRLKEIKKLAGSDHIFEDIEKEYTALENKLKEIKEDDLFQHKDEISELLRQEIVGRYYYQKGAIEASFEHDKVLERALEVLQDETSYKAFLDGSAHDKQKAREESSEQGRACIMSESGDYIFC